MDRDTGVSQEGNPSFKVLYMSDITLRTSGRLLVLCSKSYLLLITFTCYAYELNVICILFHELMLIFRSVQEDALGLEP